VCHERRKGRGERIRQRSASLSEAFEKRLSWCLSPKNLNDFNEKDTPNHGGSKSRFQSKRFVYPGVFCPCLMYRRTLYPGTDRKFRAAPETDTISQH
jgi:hypothetical protein